MKSFIWPQQIEKLTDYKLVIIPAMYSASNDTISEIEKYVDGGGHILMTFYVILYITQLHWQAWN
ncbi:beta-galactosidase trimerization domain-containing protein [Butyrivibrio sp. AE3004]|uniref:beta-galactosidase trimerization domain-containing protein n=1 Tax=Butyrivibrio sp. AE3004 TaxID=1506994 RepID=UPI0012DE3020|nr:beta-galactosidase trimerization domain-containing protein [Butyrivibrio sp. AE3004]